MIMYEKPLHNLELYTINVSSSLKKTIKLQEVYIIIINKMIRYIKHYYSNIFEGALKLNVKTVGKRFTILFI